MTGKCIAYDAKGNICGKFATIFDRKRCGLVLFGTCTGRGAPAAIKTPSYDSKQKSTREAFEGLSGTDFWTFINVLDLEKWPERMNRLKDYLEFYEELEDL